MRIPPLTPARVRGSSPPQPDAREAAGRADRLDDGDDNEVDGGVQAPQREGEARRRLVPRRQVPRRDDRDRRRDRAAVRAAQERLPHSGEAQGAVRAARHAGDAQPKPSCRRRTSQRYYKDNEQQYTTPEQVTRQPHPAQDRRQGRCGGEEAGGGSARARSKAAPTSPSSRRSIPKTTAARSRAAISTSSRKGQMVPEFDKAAFSLQPGADQRPRQVAVRLPHHQGDRQEAGRRSARSTKSARRSKISSRRSAPRRKRSGR